MVFPNESPEYRQAREQLLAAELALVQQIERVAALRRQLPAGGLLKEDYIFSGREGEVPLSSLFYRHSSLILYSFMFSADMAQACPMCSSFVDGLNANAPHISDRVELAIVAKSPLPRWLEFGQARGWRHVRLLSSESNTYNADYHGEGTWGGKLSQQPMLNVFVKRHDGIRHFWGSELFGVKGEGDPRHLDIAWPLWNVLDMTPEGRGESYPRLSYP